VRVTIGKIGCPFLDPRVARAEELCVIDREWYTAALDGRLDSGEAMRAAHIARPDSGRWSFERRERAAPVPPRAFSAARAQDLRAHESDAAIERSTISTLARHAPAAGKRNPLRAMARKGQWRTGPDLTVAELLEVGESDGSSLTVQERYCHAARKGEPTTLNVRPAARNVFRELGGTDARPNLVVENDARTICGLREGDRLCIDRQRRKCQGSHEDISHEVLLQTVGLCRTWASRMAVLLVSWVKGPHLAAPETRVAPFFATNT
jgi:hypothetical protein